VRLVAKKKKCRKGETKISWNATGPVGVAGENGSGGDPGSGGEPGANGLEGRIEKLTDRVETLAKQLQEAVGAVADVNALSSQATKLTEQTNALGGVLKGVEVLGTLLFPSLPASLPAFGCPP
jgi:hypothetical protein